MKTSFKQLQKEQWPRGQFISHIIKRFCRPAYQWYTPGSPEGFLAYLPKAKIYTPLTFWTNVISGPALCQHCARKAPRNPKMTKTWNPPSKQPSDNRRASTKNLCKWWRNLDKVLSCQPLAQFSQVETRKSYRLDYLQWLLQLSISPLINCIKTAKFLLVPQRAKNRTTIQLSNPITGYTSRGI